MFPANTSFRSAQINSGPQDVLHIVMYFLDFQNFICCNSFHALDHCGSLQLLQNKGIPKTYGTYFLRSSKEHCKQEEGVHLAKSSYLNLLYNMMKRSQYLPLVASSVS